LSQRTHRHERSRDGITRLSERARSLARSVSYPRRCRFRSEKSWSVIRRRS
jgi:hypothetical protein